MLPSRPDLAPLPEPPPDDLRARWRGALGLLVGGLVGGAAGILGVGWLDGLDVSALGLVLAVVVGIQGVLAAHELGHVVGGRLARWRFVLFVAGPLRVERKGDRLRWGLNTSLALAGGLALSVPTDVRDLGWGTAVMVAGGPVASLLLGAAGLALGGAWAIVGLTSFGIAAVTLFPGRTGGFLTDGARLLRLAKGGLVADREAAVLAVFAQSIAGVRPRDWDPDLIAGFDLADGDLTEDAARALEAARAFDMGDADTARDALVRRIALWPTVPASMRGGLATDAALFEGAVRGDGDRARAWLAHVPAKAILADPAGLALAEAAAASAEGDADSVRTYADAVREAAGSGLDDGTTAARLDWLAGLEAAAGV
ncbi:hypothetical protein [Rubrivirga sp. IMCC43871]|uniref:hypothetical protein n=1 Tax=Rubrivirga sp. IMCC43871 TaxID=3391575 RepID=UPI0039901A96